MDIDPVTGLIYYLVFLFSTALHEAGHAWAAKRGGDLTAYHGGQVSLDPIPHIRREPFGMVIMPLISVALFGWPFGYASAPYSVAWARRYPKRAGWMALAGPAGNLILIVLAVVAIRIGVETGVFTAPSSIVFDRVARGVEPGLWSSLAFLFSVIFSLNLLLLIFNLLPFPPLDGSGALPLVLSREMASRYQELIWSKPALAWIGILLAWQLFPAIYSPVWTFIVNLIHPGAHYG